MYLFFLIGDDNMVAFCGTGSEEGDAEMLISKKDGGWFSHMVFFCIDYIYIEVQEARRYDAPIRIAYICHTTDRHSLFI